MYCTPAADTGTERVARLLGSSRSAGGKIQVDDTAIKQALKVKDAELVEMEPGEYLDVQKWAYAPCGGAKS